MNSLWHWYPAIFAWSLLLISVMVGVGRFAVPGHNASLPGTYEAFAHIWCGVLLAVVFLKPGARWLSLSLLIAITALETYKFFTR